MVKIKVKGKEQWDDSDMMQFLEQMAFKLFADANDNNPVLDAEDETPFQLVIIGQRFAASVQKAALFKPIKIFYASYKNYQ